MNWAGVLAPAHALEVREAEGVAGGVHRDRRRQVPRPHEQPGGVPAEDAGVQELRQDLWSYQHELIHVCAVPSLSQKSRASSSQCGLGMGLTGHTQSHQSRPSCMAALRCAQMQAVRSLLCRAEMGQPSGRRCAWSQTLVSCLAKQPTCWVACPTGRPWSDTSSYRWCRCAAPKNSGASATVRFSDVPCSTTHTLQLHRCDVSTSHGDEAHV